MLGLIAGLLPGLFISTAGAQSSTYNPIFQFAIFYNLNLEMDPGGAMTITGPVFSNQGIWAGTANLTFGSTVGAVGQVNITSTDPFCSGKTDGTAPPHFNVAGQPVSGADALTLLPVGSGITNIYTTNAEAILNLAPPAYVTGSENAYTTNGLVYNFNACDLIISNSISGTNGCLGTNIFITYQDANDTPYLSKLTNNEVCTFSNRTTHLLYTTNSPVSLTPATNYIRMSSSFSWITNVTFWDYREGKYVQAVQINVGLFNLWLNDTNHQGIKWNQMCLAHKGHHIDSICIYNRVPLTNSTTAGNSMLPAVRVVNGQQLYGRYGLTISTPQPLYVKGDYNTTTNGTVFSKAPGNTTNTYPAALMADAITILSTNWSDAYATSMALSSRTPATTCINAATLEGIVQSTNSNYSGGIENFLRLLENWSSVYPLTYNGSIVVLFPSIYATNYWNGSYYAVPTRKWGFDNNFMSLNGLPPLTPLIADLLAIITQPTNQTILSGYNATFSVTANGSLPVSYQWNFNGTNLVGATNTSLTLTNVQASQAGRYSVTVTNIAGSITSSNATLSVYTTAAATLNGCSFSCVNGLGFQVAGVPGFNYALQESTNLIDWMPLITNTSPFSFMDANATNYPHQFYRAIWVP